MSINAISSLSLYEYYYKINNKKEEAKKSPIAKEMEEYGLTPTDSEALNIALLNRAKALALQNNENKQEELDKSERPWADVMYQLNLTFNDDPAQDIEDIKDELEKLLNEVKDEELEKEIEDLETYVEELFISYNKTHSTSINTALLINTQLDNIAMLNKANFLT